MNDYPESLPSSGLPPGSASRTNTIPASGLALVQNSFGLVAASGYTAFHGLARAASRVDVWVFWLLISKPLIDLTWNWRYVEILQQGVNLQTVVALFAFLLSALAILKIRGKRIRSMALVAFLAWTLLSVAVTPSDWAMNELLRLYSGALLFFVGGYALDTPEKLARFTRFFLLALLVPTLFVFLQAMELVPFSYWDWVDGRQVGRASGFYETPLEFVRYLLIGVPLALWMRDRSAKASFPWFLSTGFLCLSAPALFFTFHRAGWIVVGLEVFLWQLFTRKARTVMIFAFTLVVFFMLFSQRVESLFTPLTRIVNGEIDLESSELFRGRGALWAIFMDSLFSSNPAIWFIGKGGSIADGFVPGLADGVTNEPHNDFLRILHAYGIVGLSLYLLVLGGFAAIVRRLRKRPPGGFDHDVGTLLLIVLFSTVVMSITTEPMRYPTYVWYFFALASVGVLRIRTYTGAPGKSAVVFGAGA